MNNEIEQTLAIIKPDGMKKLSEIIAMISAVGLKINKFVVRRLEEDVLKEHYSHLLDKPFYPEIQEYMLSGVVAIMVLEGENAVEIQ